MHPDDVMRISSIFFPSIRANSFQQPISSEAAMVVRHGQAARNYSTVRDMIDRFPQCVVAPDREGVTLMHMAIRQEDIEVSCTEELSHLYRVVPWF